MNYALRAELWDFASAHNSGSPLRLKGFLVKSTHGEKQNKTSMSCLTFIMVLFTNFAKGSARIALNLN